MHDLICLSHLRWDFVFQRPQHLLSRCAKTRRVFFVEEPIFIEGSSELRVARSREGVFVAVPHIERNAADPEAIQRKLLLELVRTYNLEDYLLWYYTPMALGIGTCLSPIATIYDCMDQLSAFKGAPPELVEREAELMARADVVFTGGWSLYEAKRTQHPNVHAFPSSVDVAHFATARVPQEDPEDMRCIPRPRLGFFGVIDERMDLALVRGVAEARPDWQLVMVGPVVKISEAELPALGNIHYLGSKSYAELPRYISGWDVALMPFAKNESTKYISPTKTPEYLAAGRPVVSTSIKDVVRPYKAQGLVSIADTVKDFVLACEHAMREPNAVLLRKADPYLATLSWDITWGQMSECIKEAILKRHGVKRISQKAVELPLAAGAR
ncbi:MAG: glycosyltransferase family 1 protein [Polyangiaceae bacterium]|nr:glycosyltransferase family 1 protein [Polyangiaceae bacterium]